MEDKQCHKFLSMHTMWVATMTWWPWKKRVNWIVIFLKKNKLYKIIFPPALWIFAHSLHFCWYVRSVVNYLYIFKRFRSAERYIKTFPISVWIPLGRATLIFVMFGVAFYSVCVGIECWCVSMAVQACTRNDCKDRNNSKYYWMMIFF